MEDPCLPTTFDAKIEGITFSLATRQEICKASISDCPISHASQLSNPFLGLPLQTGKCESCGTGEPGQCEGHFGYIELPTPIYHPDHVSELKRLLSLLCLKCLKFKNRKSQVKNIGVMERVLASCCEETSQITINEAKTSEGACYLELKMPSRSFRDGTWNFLEKYGFRYGETYSRALLPSEVMAILRKLPQETRKKLSVKCHFPQDGYILQHLPVPPNCLSVPDVSDGISTMSTDYSITLLKKVLRQVELIKNSRSGKPNFESHEIEANDLQAAVAQYLQFRGTGKASRDVDTRFGVNKEVNASSTKAWLEKMKTLFIRKGSGFSSRSVITGDPFTGVSEIGLPFEVAQKITFEERVNQHNMEFLQKLVDQKLCLTYRDGHSTYSLREGSKEHTFLRPGQVVHRRIMDGDIVFINRPPTTHKHSLQALTVYVHDDHTVKINPLICGPLSADFDGDCIHLFYPQSLEAKAEVVELFSVEKQLLSSHTGNFNLQLATDSLLSLKILFRNQFLTRKVAQQLAMFVPDVLPKPAVVKSEMGPLWTASQILQTTLPPSFECSGERHLISKSEVLSLDFSREVMAPIVNDLITSIFFLKGPKEVLRFFNSIQPLLMDSLYSEGFSVSLRDFFLPRDVLESIQENIQKISPLLFHLRDSYSESIALQLESYLRTVKTPVTNFIQKSSRIGSLIDSKSESALSKVVQQIGFLGLQISDRGKFYSQSLVKDMSSLFQKKYPSCLDYPTEAYGLVGRPLFRGLDPYQEMVHSISSREVIVRSTRGLTEPGTLFKNLMAILRDVVICHDGTVRNMCSNSVIQFEYGVNSANMISEFCAGDPVGVLAATAMSNPAYKAVLDSSANSNSSWEMMKEILLCGVSFKNDVSDRRVILYLNDCDCGRKHCQENAALVVKNQLKKVSLKDTAIEFLIEYRSQTAHEIPEINPGLVGHIHLNKTQLIQSNISMHHILEKCQDTISLHQKKKKVGNLFKRIGVSFSDCCSFCQPKSKWTDVPCIQFIWQSTNDDILERVSHFLADAVCPELLETIIKGDPRVSTADVTWISPDSATWIRSPSKSLKGELAVDVILEKEAVRKNGDAWRVVMDCCLPVMHVIDTRRSIPYSIKQVQELLGISCAFEQAVQRLSTSVTMVTKGVLKDHLLLLGNSMTCAGTLIGFNAGGIKSLSRSLNVQVPFMNATLFTPRKCFEKAAEKCHVDNLSSIVASCAWGKHVSVGTGCPFEILWDTRKAELRPQKEIDVYNFLHLVNSCSKPEDMNTSCLGAEIEDLDQEDEFMEFDLSPVRESGADKPTFEDGVEFEDAKENDWTMTAEQSTWDVKITSDENDWTSTTGQSTWGEKAASEENDWSKKTGQSSWGEKAAAREEDQMKAADQNSWGKKVDPEENNWAKKADQTSWGEKVDSGENNWTKKAEKSMQGEEAQTTSAWGKQRESDGGVWGRKDEQNKWATSSPKEPSGHSNWGAAFGGKDWGVKNDRRDSGEMAWKKNDKQTSWGNAKTDNQSSWGRDASYKEDVSSAKGNNTWDAKVAVDQETDAKTSNDWGTGQKTKSSSDNWGSSQKKPDDSTAANAWGSSKADNTRGPSNDWGSGQKADQETGAKPSNDWATGQKTESPSDNWGSSQKKPDDSTAANAWGSSKADNTRGPLNDWGSGQKADQETGAKPSNDWATGQKTESPSDNWGSSQKKPDDSTATNAWGSSKADNMRGPLNDWGSGQKADQETGAKPSNDWATGQKTESPSDNWGSSQKKLDDSTAANAWGSTKADNPWGSSSDWGSGQKTDSPNDNWGSSQTSWGSSKVDASNEKDGQPQWGRGRGRGRGRGWGRGRGSRESSQGRGPSNDGDWKNKRPRSIDDPNAPPLFTVTRQRLDLFTMEEQDILLETESIMKNIRKIMNQMRDKDDDPLSTDDQTYIIDNVFNYHPDKAAKMGGGIDHIMVSRHVEFQDSRCFYAVSVDGGKADFSYRKCLENFLKGKYPEKAESFIPKYFRKPQPRPGWNRDNQRGPPRNESGTSSWSNRDSTPAPDEAGTPRGWGTPRNESGTASWNSTPAPAEAGTPGGWGTPRNESAAATWNSPPAPDEAGTPGGWGPPRNESGITSWSNSTPAPDEGGTPGGWNGDQPTPSATGDAET